MGTSQSHNLKSSPNWSAAKRAMTSLANGTDNKPASNAKFFGNLGIALDNGLYRGGRIEGHGGKRGGSYRRANTGESAAAMPPGEMRPGGRGLPAPFGRQPPEGGDTGTDGGTECKGVEATGVGQQLSGADGFADESCLRGACRQGVPAGDE